MSGQQQRKGGGFAACKGCKRRVRMETLSGSMLCGSCLSGALILSWAKVTDAITWGASDCPMCAIGAVDQVAERERRHREEGH